MVEKLTGTQFRVPAELDYRVTFDIRSVPACHALEIIGESQSLTFRQALTIYFFSLGVILMLGGILSQLGVMEVAGLEVARAWGYTSTQGLAMLLGFRIVWVLSIWLVSGVMIVVLRSQLRASHRDGSEEPVH